MTEELVAVYDADGNVVGEQPRSRVYAEGLQDHLLSVAIGEALETGNDVETRREPWAS